MRLYGPGRRAGHLSSIETGSAAGLSRTEFTTALLAATQHEMGQSVSGAIEVAQLGKVPSQGN